MSLIIQLPNVIKNQLTTQSCFACASAILLQQHYQCPELSTNFIYGFSDEKDNTGLDINQTCQRLIQYGDCLINECPGVYEHPEAHSQFLKYIDKINYNKNYKIQNYLISDNIDIKNNLPLIALLNWPSAYQTQDNDILSFSYQTLKHHYHSVIIYGYNDLGYICRNSYGPQWGNNGNFILQYKDKKIIYQLIKFYFQ